MKKNYSIISQFAFLFIFVPALVVAANPFNIQYPIEALGGCASQEECKIYCDNSENEGACLKWAQNNGLAPKSQQKRQMSSDGRGVDAQQRPIDEDAFRDAPGGCKTPRECDAYCRVEEHLNQCLDYSVKYGYTSREEADKVREQANRGGPGGCKSEKQCNDFCRVPENAKECMAFVVAEGKLTQEEADFMTEQMQKGKPGKSAGRGPIEPKIKQEKAEAALKQDTGPGGCKNMEECRVFCQDGSHIEECIAFAEKHHLMPQEEVERAKKLGKIGGPGGCKNSEECDAFCEKEENRNTCFSFARDNGMLSPEEIRVVERQMQLVQKLDKKAGPGGCRTREECDRFCSDKANVETCINFARDGGMMSGDTVERMMGQTEDGDVKMRRIEEFQKFKEMETRDGMNDPLFGIDQSSSEVDRRMPAGDERFVPPRENMIPAEQMRIIDRGKEDFVPLRIDTGTPGDMVPQPRVEGYSSDMMPPGGIRIDGPQQYNMQPPREMIMRNQQMQPMQNNVIEIIQPTSHNGLDNLMAGLGLLGNFIFGLDF